LEIGQSSRFLFFLSSFLLALVLATALAGVFEWLGQSKAAGLGLLRDVVS
jgi:hypothetical protein